MVLGIDNRLGKIELQLKVSLSLKEGLHFCIGCAASSNTPICIYLHQLELFRRVFSR